MNLVLRWALINFGVIGVFLWGTYLPNEGLVSLSVFMFWLTSIMGLFAFSEEFAKSILKSKPDYKFSVRQEIDITLDVLVSIMLAYHGYIVLSAFYAFHIFGLQAFRENVTKIQNAEKQKVTTDEKSSPTSN